MISPYLQRPLRSLEEVELRQADAPESAPPGRDAARGAPADGSDPLGSAEFGPAMRSLER